VQSFPTVPPQDWHFTQWIGFFTALRGMLGEGEWEAGGHGGGGYNAFRWHWSKDKHLALTGATATGISRRRPGRHEGELRFKIVVPNENKEHQRAKRDEWNKMLKAKARSAGVNLVTPRGRLGKRMTVAVLDGDYRQCDHRGLLDMTRTVEMLRR